MKPSPCFHKIRRFVVLLACLAICSPARSQQLNDSTLKARGFWDSKAVNISIVPVVLFAGSAALWGERKNVRELRNRYIPSFRHHFDDYMQYVPALAVFGLNAAGVKGKNHIGILAGPSYPMLSRPS